MVPREPRRVVRIRPSAAATRMARHRVDALIASAVADLAAAQAGDLVRVHGAVLDLLQAVRITVRHGLDVDQEVAS